MSILTLVQRACRRVRKTPPQGAVSSTDPDVALFVEMAIEDALDRSRQFDWPATLKERSFTTVAGIDQPSALPADYSRMAFKSDNRGSLYDTTRRSSVNGPETAGVWRDLPYAGNAVYPSWRIFGGVLQLSPPPGAGRVMSLAYVTTDLWGTGRLIPDADTQTCLVPEELIILGMIWRWKQVNSLDYAEDMQNANLRFEQISGTARGDRSNLVVGVRRLGIDVTLPFPGTIVR